MQVLKKRRLYKVKIRRVWNMKIKSKKLTVATAFILGTVVFVSAAFADMAVGSGYDNLKNSIKNTASVMEKDLSSFTMETIFTLKSNGEDLTQNVSFVKIDNTKNANEERSFVLLDNGEKVERYSYFDSQTRISKSSYEDKYFVTEFPSTESNMQKAFRNPFEEDMVPEVEKVIDAVVGSLKDYVQVQENSDGSRKYSGSLNETQIPAVANAISAFIFKTEFRSRAANSENELNRIEKDIFIKSVTGEAKENKDGILESLTASVAIQGIDKYGQKQELAVDVVAKLSDINNTVVVKPDLTGKEVQKYSESKFGGIDSKYVGNYKNDIIIEKDGKFVKIGERNLTIAHVEDNSIAGRYYEVINPEYESYLQNRYDFTFDFNPNGNNPSFTYKNSKGQTESGFINVAGTSKLYFDLNVQYGSKPLIYDNMFTRVFE